MTERAPVWPNRLQSLRLAAKLGMVGALSCRLDAADRFVFETIPAISNSQSEP
jgi:hypothetical protein